LVWVDGSFWITDASTLRVYPFVPPPDAPTGVTASDGTQTGCVTISWNPTPGAQEYRVFRSEMEYSLKIPVSDWQTNVYFEDTSVVPGDTYYYWVCARWDRQGLVGPFNSTAETGCGIFGATVF
jgi:hypothetical protein